MRKSVAEFIGRFVALFIALTLILPNPALAFRPDQIGDTREEKKSRQLSGLEEALQSSNPDRLLQLASATLGIGTPRSAPSPTVTMASRVSRARPEGAGMEEEGILGKKPVETPDQAKEVVRTAIAGLREILKSHDITDEKYKENVRRTIGLAETNPIGAIQEQIDDLRARQKRGGLIYQGLVGLDILYWESVRVGCTPWFGQF